MWVLIAREPAPDAPYWPGRRVLAAIDAVGWPAVWVLLLHPYVGRGGLVVAVAVALAVVCAVGRLRRAWYRNHRYRFTTWRWGKAIGAIVLFGLILRTVLT